MVLAISYDEAKKNQVRRTDHDREGEIVQTPLLGSRRNPDLPLAHINALTAGRTSTPHFHNVDQFQVILEGSCTLGRHRLKPYTVHFSRAYTPYGPIVSEGVRFFVIRAHPDTGSQRLPKELAQLNAVPDRDPWQVTCEVAFPAQAQRAGEVTLTAIPGMSDQRGLAGYTLNMAPRTQTHAPDPSVGDGQYVVVLKGSLLHDGRELKAPALAWVYPQDGALPMKSGVEGLHAMILNFPERKAIAQRAEAPAASTGFRKWQCALCAFAYDEALGMPDDGIAPGTRWEDVPESWNCPDCSAAKSDFEMVEVE